MVMAPIKKNKVSAVSPRCSLKMVVTCANTTLCSAAVDNAGSTYSAGFTIKSVQQATHIKSATGALFTFVKLSKAMQR